MDKKQSLSPDLQKIYEKVMNTPSQPQSNSINSAPVPPPSTPNQSVQTPPIPNPPIQTSTVPQPPIPVASSPSKGFVFTSSNTPPPAAHTPPGAATGIIVQSKNKVPAKLLVFAGITFMVFYAVFWLKFFKYF